MCKITESPAAFAAAVLDTPFNAIAVKRKGKTFRELLKDDYAHGLIVSPLISEMVTSDEDLRRHLVDDLKEPFVRVRGHGWTFEKPFVWSGTTAEFLATWQGD